MLHIYERMCEWDWSDLRQPLLEVILSFYNGDFDQDPSALLDHLSGTFEILNFWRMHGKLNPEEGLTPKNLLNFFVDIVIQVISEILDKVLHKAIHKYKIISLKKPKDQGELSEEENCDEAPMSSEFLSTPHLFSYSEKPEQFDGFIDYLWRYLDLMNKTSPLIEDLYVNVMDIMRFERTN